MGIIKILSTMIYHVGHLQLSVGKLQLPVPPTFSTDDAAVQLPDDCKGVLRCLAQFIDCAGVQLKANVGSRVACLQLTQKSV